MSHDVLPLENGWKVVMGTHSRMDYMLKCLSHSLCLNPEASASGLSLYSLLGPELHLCAGTWICGVPHYLISALATSLLFTDTGVF